MITLEVDKVDAGAAEKFEIEPNSLKSWKLITNIPKDASFRSRDIAVGMKITGYIIPGYKDTAGDSTLKLAEWARVPSASADAYRHITLKQISVGVVERLIEFQDCYVANYKEHFDSQGGDGTFEMEVRIRRIAKQDVLFGFNAGFTE